MVVVKLKLVCIVLLLIPLAAAAEDFAELPGGVRKVCVLAATNLSPGADAAAQADYKEFFDKTLVLELTNAGFDIIGEELWKEKQQQLGYSDIDLIDGTKAIDLAASLGADVVIKQFYFIQEDKITFGIKCYDVSNRILRVQSLREESAGLVIISSINKFIIGMVPLIKERMQPFSGVGEDLVEEKIVEELVKRKEYVAKGKIVDLVLYSPDDGAEIKLGDVQIGTIAEGRLPVKAQVNSTLLLDIEKEGFHTENKFVDIAEEDLEFELSPLMKKSTWGLKLEYSFFQFLGAGIGGRIYFRPDRLGLDLTNYPYFQAANRENSNLILHNDTNFTFFVYPFIKPSSFFRFNVIMGMGVISTFILEENMPVYFDIYFDGGGSVEMNFPHFILYFKEYGRYVFDIFQSGLLGTQMAPPIGVQLTFGVLLKW